MPHVVIQLKLNLEEKMKYRMWNKLMFPIKIQMVIGLNISAGPSKELLLTPPQVTGHPMLMEIYVVMEFLPYGAALR